MSKSLLKLVDDLKSQLQDSVVENIEKTLKSGGLSKLSTVETILAKADDKDRTLNKVGALLLGIERERIAKRAKQGLVKT